jgi:ribosomal protein S27AE
MEVVMKIKCGKCGYQEEVNMKFFVKLIGAALPAGGFWAWVTFLFAGTGFAMPICIAIATGGLAMLWYAEEIAEWITRKGYICPKCHTTDWKVVSKQEASPEDIQKAQDAVQKAKLELEEVECEIKKAQQEYEAVSEELARQREYEEITRANVRCGKCGKPLQRCSCGK